MKRIILSFIIAFLGLTSLQAQETTFGIKGGVNFANLTNPYSIFFEKIEIKVGFHIGVLAEIKLNEKWSLQPELLYSQQGTQITEDLAARARRGSLISKLNFDYLSLPILAKYYVADRFNLHAGPQIGYLIAAEGILKISGESENIHQEDLKDMTDNLDYGIALGAGYELKNGIFFNARYYLGLVNITDPNRDEEKIKNSVLQVSVGYKL